jgi:hypothetical protein
MPKPPQAKGEVMNKTRCNYEIAGICSKNTTKDSGIVKCDLCKHLEPPEKEPFPFDPQSMDAVVWAKEFMRIYNSPKIGNLLLDEDLMRAWFANAIMAGYDEARRRYEKSGNKSTSPETPKRIEELEEAGHPSDSYWILASKINELVKVLNGEGK